MKMHLLLSILTIVSSTLNVMAGESCLAPEKDVLVQVKSVHPGDVGPSVCYVSEVNGSRYFEVLDCGYLSSGDVVSGTVFTYWTTKDSSGAPVCNYQTFVPRF